MNAEKITVDSTNIYALVRYTEAAREFNRFVKENFSKKTRENEEVLSVSPIIDDLHREVDILEKKISDYKKRNHNCIKEGAFYLMTDKRYNEKEQIGERSYLHILHKSPDGKRLSTEELRVNCFGGTSKNISTYLKDKGTHRTEVSSIEYLDAFYSGRLKEIDENEWMTIREAFETAMNI